MKREFNLNYDSPREIKTLLDMMGLGPRKRWGQNFLINPGARKRIVDELEIEGGDIIWEIGPGLGAMTKDILSLTDSLTAFEIDPGYCEYLQLAFAERGLELVQGDVMKTWKEHWKEKDAPHKILGNLPYNAASAIIGDLLENHSIPQRMVFMLQAEMADRMTAKRGSKNYSSFSILCQYHCDIAEAGKLTPGSFYPAPRVASKIVVMTPSSRELKCQDWAIFYQLVRGLFISRRKTIRNNLIPLVNNGFGGGDMKAIEEVFLANGNNFKQRPEELSVIDFIKISNGLDDLVKS